MPTGKDKVSSTIISFVFYRLAGASDGTGFVLMLSNRLVISIRSTNLRSPILYEMKGLELCRVAVFADLACSHYMGCFVQLEHQAA
jgi:hypothetical protein